MIQATAGEKPQSATVETAQKRDAEGDACEVRYIHKESVEAGVREMLPAGEYGALAATFQALADPTRIKIVYSLMARELCTCDLAAVIGISEPGVSQHLNVLRRLRLVASRREGKMVYHSLNDDHIGALLAVCLEHVRDQQPVVA
jgi:DNA-binding transcriptional ArsR family regulator